MKSIKLLFIFSITILLFSCSEELIQEDLTSQEVKQLTFRSGADTYSVSYKIDDGALVYLSEFPDELEALKENESIQMKLNDQNELVLFENSDQENRLETRGSSLGEYASFYAPYPFYEINHFCYAVTDMESAVANYTNELQTGCWYKPKLVTKQYYINGVPQDYDVNLIFTFSGSDQIEVLEGSTQGDNIFANFLQVQDGLHHLGFSVCDLEGVTEIFENNGYTSVISGNFVTKLGLQSNVEFFDTRAEIGVYTEIVESKLFGFNVTSDEALLIFGLLLGDVDLMCQ